MFNHKTHEYFAPRNIILAIRYNNDCLFLKVMLNWQASFYSVKGGLITSTQIYHSFIIQKGKTKHLMCKAEAYCGSQV